MHVDTWRAAYGDIVPGAHLEGLSYAESKLLWRDAIARRDGGVFVAEDGDGIFGFASGGPRERFSRDLTGYGGELRTVYVLPSHGRRGAGSRLVRVVVRDLAERGYDSMLLWTFAENRPARGFYESLGGAVVAEDRVEVGGARLPEVAYGWPDLEALLERLAGS